MSGAVYDRTTNLGLGLLEFSFPNWGDDANENMKLLDISVGMAGVQISGVWHNSTAYTAGQLVADGVMDLLFRCLVAHTSGDAPITFAQERAEDPTHWIELSTILHARGQWQTATSYYINDVVYKDANKYSWAMVTRAFTSSSTYDDDVATGALVIITDTTNTVNVTNASKNAAAASATAAAGSASAAATSATTASNHAANALTSANASANNAAVSVSARDVAIANANASSASATAAATSATNASNSATAAAGSAASAAASLAQMLPDAPADSKTYGRRNHIWQEVASTSLPEAPFDSKKYARYNGTWTDVTAGLALDWADITGKPATFPPTLPIPQSGVTNLVTDLAAKAPMAALPTFTGVDAATDWDSIPATAGWYPQLLGTTNAHHPFAGQYFFCQTLLYTGGSQILQIAYPYATAASVAAGIWYRGRYTGAWTAWVHVATTDDVALKAPIASPTFTGNPQAPTPSPGDNDTSVATTAFVADAVATAVNAAVPVGACVNFPAINAPTGWLKLNGALLSRTTYAALWAFAQASGNLAASDAAWVGNEGKFSPGGGSTDFRIPDARGVFLRGWDDARGVDAGRTIGSNQVDGIGTHLHAVSITSGLTSAGHTHAVSGTSGINSADHTHTFSDSSSATGTGSANHSHGYDRPSGVGSSVAGGTVNLTSVQTLTSGAAHTHTVAVSGTTGANSVDHTHAISFTSGAMSADHTHLVSGNTANNTGALAETRPRNVALLACIKY